jgi:phospholipid/cholesterol/gamma-HCH transport system permease protein
MTRARFHMDCQQQQCSLTIAGCWELGAAPDGAALCDALPGDCRHLLLNTEQLQGWDSSLVMALLHLSRHCERQHTQFHTGEAPPNLQRLLALATDVPVQPPETASKPEGRWARLRQRLTHQGHEVQETLIFVGDVCLALGRWLTGRAKTRGSDIGFFVVQAGPQALPIVTLIAVLVGMILAYLGAVQLQQWGAQVYVANLVSLGMVREMGALMTAVIMAGRTGAAFAAQLGTMQANDEIDALRVMGISSMEFLVLPRLLALVLVMPLLCIYADVIGMAGGAIVATTMDVSLTQYLLQTQGAVGWIDITTGLVKSFVFGILIAVAGCQAGIHCGRNSTAVGLATTHAVVRAIVYLVVADAGFNILYDKMGI